jgi:hypothetical protein
MGDFLIFIIGIMTLKKETRLTISYPVLTR